MSSTSNAPELHTSYEPFMVPWSRQLFLRLSIWPGSSDPEPFLDVGCETGSLTRVILESRRRINHRRRRLADANLESATTNDPRSAGSIQTGDATSLHLRTTVLTGAFAIWFFIRWPMQKFGTKCGGFALVWGRGGSQLPFGWSRWNAGAELFWDAAATPSDWPNGKVLRNSLRPMTRPN